MCKVYISSVKKSQVQKNYNMSLLFHEISRILIFATLQNQTHHLEYVFKEFFVTNFIYDDLQKCLYFYHECFRYEPRPFQVSGHVFNYSFKRQPQKCYYKYSECVSILLYSSLTFISRTKRKQLFQQIMCLKNETF